MDGSLKISRDGYQFTLKREIGIRLYCLEEFKWYLTMKWLEISKYCPCRKGEDCVNGLKCCEKNCFLLKVDKAETGHTYLYR